MAEEHRCQAPRLCLNNCGFFGVPATQNLCSKCYRDLQLKEQQSSSAKIALNNTLAPFSSPSSSPRSPVIVVPVSSPVVNLPAVEEVEVESVAVQPDRCLRCRKRVGLTGFKCRCGMTFCGTHRYAEKHGCTFDFKSMDRDAIAKANPVVKAQKLDKI